MNDMRMVYFVPSICYAVEILSGDLQGKLDLFVHRLCAYFLVIFAPFAWRQAVSRTMADEKQSENSIFTFIRGTSKILEKLQREDEKEIESDNPASDYESDLSEVSGGLTDPSVYDGAFVDQ